MNQPDFPYPGNPDPPFFLRTDYRVFIPTVRKENPLRTCQLLHTYVLQLIFFPIAFIFMKLLSFLFSLNACFLSLLDAWEIFLLKLTVICIISFYVRCQVTWTPAFKTFVWLKVLVILQVFAQVAFSLPHHISSPHNPRENKHWLIINCNTVFSNSARGVSYFPGDSVLSTCFSH